MHHNRFSVSTYDSPNRQCAHSGRYSESLTAGRHDLVHYFADDNALARHLTNSMTSRTALNASA